MDIWSMEKLSLFILFVMPGFISAKVYNLFIPVKEKEFQALLLNVICYSSLNFFAFLWLINIISDEKFYTAHPGWSWFFLTVILCFFPIFWGWIFVVIPQLKSFRKYMLNPIKRPWDVFFIRRESCWVIITLKDGRKIGGKFGKNSWASSYPEKEQIYLEEVWAISKQGGFQRAIERSFGMIISSDNFLTIEFLK